MSAFDKSYLKYPGEFKAHLSFLYYYEIEMYYILCFSKSNFLPKNGNYIEQTSLLCT